AHESPVIFFSCVLGAIGPLMVITVPPIRTSLGWKPAESIPTTYPLPNRPRRPVQGYEDE
ncbi:NADH-ubiquinone oxidoreductase 9.5 kDa subunit, partial [Postia placenta Mad-698-R]